MVRPEELARTLVRRHREERLANERRAATILAAAREELRAVIRGGRARRAWVIGSIVSGRFGIRSDLDVVLDGGDASADGELRADLEHHLGVPVDLLRLDDLPASFRERVLREGVAVDDAG